MKKRIINGHSALRFKQFSRRGYALFAVLGKVVIVGVLSVPTLLHAKAEGISIDAGAARDTLVHNEIGLDEVVVTGSHAPLSEQEAAKMIVVVPREDIACQAGAASVNDLMQSVSDIDVRQRGAFGVQTDISLRGGNFDQITFLLNGVNISSPHTGHLSADFPLSPDDIERIEVVPGSAARTYGASAFNGVINIITRKNAPLVNARISAGSYGYINGNAGVNIQANHFSSYVCGGYTRSDGATANSAFSFSRLFWQGAINTKRLTLNAQIGYGYKPYEANTFYGAASADQWESNERVIASLNADIRVGCVHITPQIYWNRWFDHYQWHHSDPAGENYHRSDASGGAISAWTETRLGKTSAGADIRRETIWSTKLGLLQEETKWRNTAGHDGTDGVKYMYHDGRTTASLFLEHNILLRRWTVSLGATAIHTNLAGWSIEPGADIAYRPNTTLKLFAAFNTGLRLPTFTDLYYSGANIEGNSNLKPERSTDAQIGIRKTWKGIRAEAEIYFSHKSDMIDWITYEEAADDIFHSVNFRMNNFGGSIDVVLRPTELWGESAHVRQIAVKYAYINEHSRYIQTVIESKYAMDYLRNKVVISADGWIWSKLNLSLSWRFNDRIGKGNADYALLDGRFSWDEKHWAVYVDATNIFNRKYFDYISIPQPGIVVIAGIKLTI